MELIVTTSKIALKTSCMRACGNDVERAERLYEFFVKDLANLPDFDVVPPTPFEQTKDFLVNAFSWIDNNQDKIVGYYNIYQQLRGGQPLVLPNAPTALPDAPPIPIE